MQTADILAGQGYLDAGYDTLVLDDGWAERERNAAGCLVPNHKKFPHGMKWLSDYVHGKGLRFGIYSCAGTLTCAGFPSSFEHEFEDAETFAAWGVDFLKYDCCNKPSTVPAHVLYKRMAMALRSCGRPILFSACNAGLEDAQNWMRSAGAHMWRSYYDIVDSWDSVRTIAKSQLNREAYNGPCCFNDLDMLVVGMNGKGNVGQGGCTCEEYRTHFSLWCLMASPLMIGCDLRTADDEAKKILLNADLIRINQDAEGRQAYTILFGDGDDVLSYIKPLEDGSYAIGLFNLSDDVQKITLSFWDMGLPYMRGLGFRFYDCWEQQDIGTFRECYRAKLPAHGCRVFRATLVRE